MIAVYVASILLFAALAWLRIRLNLWESWETQNPEPASMIFAGRSQAEVFLRKMRSEPPDKYSDLWS